MTKKLNCSVLVVGAGPGGYVAAIRAGQLGLDTIIVEADRQGGTCLIRGCIPSKAMIHVASKFEEMTAHAKKPLYGISLEKPPAIDLKQAVAWKDTIVDRLNGGVETLLKKANVRTVKGWATFTDGKTCLVDSEEGKLQIQSEHVILATGSIPTELPNLPFGGPVISSTEALDLEQVPENLVVVGAGYIGLELGMAYRKLGSKVTFVEALDRVLPLFDREMAKPVERWLKMHKVPVHLNAKATGLKETKKGAFLQFEEADGSTKELAADKVLVTVGRRPNTSGWGIENMAIDLEGPFVKIDAHCRTSMKNVWAIGDLTGEPMLAHKASAQGELVAEVISGETRLFEPAAIPAVCFTEPEVIGVGLSPDEAKEKGIETIVGRFPFAANGRALAMGAGVDGGFVRVTARKDNHLVLGIHAAGAHVSELSGEFVHAIEMGAVLEDVAGTIHAHPTLSEAFHEAALNALGHAIHIA